MMNEWYSRLKIRILLAFKPVVFFNLLNQLDWYQETLQAWVKNNDFPDNSKILEIGCATGALTRYISDLNHDITGVDISESMVEVARTNNPNISFNVSDVNKLPFKSESFDSVISASLINIVNDREKALKEMMRVCKNGGTISILAPLVGFSDTKLNSLILYLETSGFSSEALKAWHQLAPKMTVLELNNLFKKLGLKVQKPEKYLKDMVFSITAVKQSTLRGS